MVTNKIGCTGINKVCTSGGGYVLGLRDEFKGEAMGYELTAPFVSPAGSTRSYLRDNWELIIVPSVITIDSFLNWSL